MASENNQITPPCRHEVWKMFDRIAPRYDFLNHLLSFGWDKVWRRKLARRLPDRHDLDILDLATGTADQLLTLFKTGKVRAGVGIDPSEKMLQIGRQKIENLKLSDKIKLLAGSAEMILCKDDSFDIVSITFGIRNVANVLLALSEMHRVLRHDGQALILEFSLPRNKLIKKIYLFYFRKILPHLGSFISGDSYAYRYLNETAESFPYGEAFCDIMRTAGFKNVQAWPLTFGVVTLYRGYKV